MPATTTKCRKCGDTPDPRHPGLGVFDHGHDGGLGGCGDLHDWEVPPPAPPTKPIDRLAELAEIGRRILAARAALPALRERVDVAESARAQSITALAAAMRSLAPSEHVVSAVMEWDAEWLVTAGQAIRAVEILHTAATVAHDAFTAAVDVRINADAEDVLRSELLALAIAAAGGEPSRLGIEATGVSCAEGECDCWRCQFERWSSPRHGGGRPPRRNNQGEELAK